MTDDINSIYKYGAADESEGKSNHVHNIELLIAKLIWSAKAAEIPIKINSKIFGNGY